MEHQKRTWMLVAGACLLSSAVLAGGCAQQSDREAAWSLPETRAAATPAFCPPAGNSWSLVFNSPTVNRTGAAADARQYAEYSRNDAALNSRNNGPILASGEWPERERPDLAYPRRVYLDPRADQLLFFDYESRYRTYGGYRSVPVGPGDGQWGFWR